MWEVNNSDTACKEATKAYQEAMSICQWNFEPTDPYLLHVALNFTTHLNSANDTDMAIVVLKRVIQDTQAEDLENYDFLNKSYIKLILKYLDENLVRFQITVDQKRMRMIELIEESEIDNRLPEELLLDGVTTRRQG